MISVFVKHRNNRYGNNILNLFMISTTIKLLEFHVHGYRSCIMYIYYIVYDY